MSPFENIIKQTIFEFWGYAARISTDFPSDYDSREHVL